MRIRRAIGAAGLVLATTAGLSGCADDPKDKAFGGLGDVGDLPSAPSVPSPGSTDVPGLSSGGSSNGGTSSGGLSSGGSSGVPTPSSPPTYNPSAIGEVDGERCRYSRSLGRISYDVEIQNSSNDQAFRYNFTVSFKIGSSPSSSIATRTIGSRFKTVTVSPGGSRSVTVDVSHSTNQRLVYSCQVTTASKSPAS
ncbi:hypothetical protein ACH4RA_31440 [Streptomyces smyrnaeus]|uniref:Uncharacterized protein n=1 Tax=Streptomyces smyrnaeus TaxID=1387713 RepID=A0ABS3Y6N9_9ACTN|nr:MULTISPECIES: hypothetical protein [Streptomyces]MBO8203344.1 hypothetical protein [Streptomyces smyrnaeus]MBQ0867823.1 hypothetical protein [Streptomyces sp. RK75]MBQ1119138.1 hypothetical protein [Streptomyces sp. B15]MBQ1160627.1 hypothetical protein [Streptomyces sp. A73]